MKVDCWYLVEGGEYKDNVEVLGMFSSSDEAEKLKSALSEAAPGYYYIVTPVPAFNTAYDCIGYMAEQNQRKAETKRQNAAVKIVKQKGQDAEK